MLDDESIERLLERAHSEREVLGELLERYRAYLTVIARQRLGTKLAVRTDASDIVQQTLLEAHLAFAGFRGATEAEFSRWIQEIHGNNLAEAVQKHVHAAKRSIKKEHPLVDADGSITVWIHEPAADQTSPSQQVIKGEKALRLAEALESLPEMQREAVRLRHLEGWHLEDIAAHLGRSLPATAGLIKRGIARLREKMQEHSSQ